MSTKLEIGTVIQAAIASQGSWLEGELNKSMGIAASKIVKRRQEVGKRRLCKLRETGGNNNLLPFVLEKPELSAAIVLLDQPMLFNPNSQDYFYSKPSDFAKIYSAWSVIDCGYAHFSEGDCIYISDIGKASLVKETGSLAFELRPARKSAFESSIDLASNDMPSVTVDSSGDLQFVIDVEINASIMPRKISSCSLFDAKGCGHEIKDIEVFLGQQGQPTVRFRRSESILLLSAAAKQNYWIHIKSDPIDWVFPVPDLTLEHPVVPLWSRTIFAGQGYLDNTSLRMIEVPEAAAKECVRRYWWVTLSDKKLMFDAVSEMHSTGVRIEK